MGYMILKLNLVAILLLFESFVKTDIIHKGIIQNSEAVEIKENYKRKLSNDDGGYMKLYFNSEANYSTGFKNGQRRDISYIINGDNDIHIAENESFIIGAGNHIEIHFKSPPTILEYFLAGHFDTEATKIVSIDLSHLDTSSLTDMKYMFYNCSSLESIDLSNFNAPLLTNMQGMFSHCVSLKSMNLSNFNISSVTLINSLFSNCNSLKSINLPNFNKSSVTDMSYMFSNCNSLNQ